MADNDTVLKGFSIQSLKMKLGNQGFSKRVYVASIGDDMLLGHDLLHHLGVCLDMQTDTLVLNGERIPITTSFKDSRLIVARVSVRKRVTVPPNSVVRLTCKLNTKIQEDYFVVSDSNIYNKISESQAEFREGYSTIDNAFILYSLIHKHLSKKHGRLYVAFVDLTKAFDLINRRKLWKVVSDTGIKGKLYKKLVGNVYFGEGMRKDQ